MHGELLCILLVSSVFFFEFCFPHVEVDLAQDQNSLEDLVEYLNDLDDDTKQSFGSDWKRLINDLDLDKCVDSSQSRRVLTYENGGKCGVSILKGRRSTQQDNVVCSLGNQLPPLQGKKLSFNLLAIFDGHGGEQASVICAECFHSFLLFHVHNISMAAMHSPEVLYPLSTDTTWPAPVSMPTLLWKVILKEAVRRAILHVEETFVNRAVKNVAEGGTTACIAIELDGHLLVANVGDTKALLCTSSGGELQAEELTTDHHPERDDEKARIEAFDGYVERWGGIPRVVGVLAVSRSIGDLSFKRFGVTSEPEFTPWRSLRNRNKYLVLASDGILESMRTQDVCTVIEAVAAGENVENVLEKEFVLKPEPIALPPPTDTVCAAEGLSGADTEEDFIGDQSSLLHRMAAAVAEASFKLGSRDNMATVIYALGTAGEDNEGGERETMQQLMPTTSSFITFPAFPEVPVDRNTRSLVTGVLIGHSGAQFCYLLKEPLNRDIISHVNFNVHSGSLERALTSDERLCLSSPEPLCTELQLRPASVPPRHRLLNFMDRIISVPMDADSFITSNLSSSQPPFVVQHYRYILKKKFARGSFGEIWLAVRKDCADDEKQKTSFCRWQFYDDTSSSEAYSEEDEIFVLKQILLKGHPSVRLSGLREKHFGEIFLNASQSQIFEDEQLNHIARFVDYIEDEDLWLVFRKEGQSLSRLLYEVSGYNSSEEQRDKGSFQVLNPSSWWRWLKTTTEGQDEMRSLLYQLLLGVKACHDRNITHRDIKPENMVVEAGGRNSTWQKNLHMRIIDFGSAIDSFTLEHLYGSSGPTRSEHTPEYSPPEALLLEHWMHLHPHQTKAYDIWSVGVVMLEMILGTPHVFQISSRTRLLLDRNLAAWDQDSRNVAYMLRAFMEMCILLPRVNPQHNHKTEDENRLAMIDCSEAALLRKIQQRDPMGVGVPNVLALRLLRMLLQWYPEDRISVDDALQHPYFVIP